MRNDAKSRVARGVNAIKFNRAHGSNLEIVLCETLNIRAISRVGSPASRRLIASRLWCRWRGWTW
jgi:hypothetical protein